MGAMEYFKTKNRMTKGCSDPNCCFQCPLSFEFNGMNIYCRAFEKSYPEKAIEIVYNWGKEHPEKTMMQDFFEKFPNTQKDGQGVPELCPFLLGYTNENTCKFDDCFKCWSRPIE